MKKNIFVTGSHRSGSSWTATVLSKAPKVRYIQEPFNLEMDRANSPLRFWFEYVDGMSAQEQKAFQRYMNSFFSLAHLDNLKRILRLRSRQDIARFYYDFEGVIFSNRKVIKDPHAIMSAEWFYKNYDCDIVLLIRHPAAFVASLKVKNWEFDFNNYLKQHQLMEDHLKSFSKQITEFAERPPDIIDQGILLWNTIYHVASSFETKYSNDWIFVKHEDLSNNPFSCFQAMFDRLGLVFDEKVSAFIYESTQANKKTDLKRNSRANVQTWKKRLSEKEIERIKEGTSTIWRKYYTESDW